MINHIIDVAGMLFSKIDPIKRIPTTLSTQLYIDHNIKDINANVITTSEILDTTLILLYDNIGEYHSNSIFTTETFKTFPSISNDKYIHTPSMSRYIFVPDFIKNINTSIETTSFITYNVINEIIKGINYTSKRAENTFNTLPLILTTYILCEYNIVSSGASVLNALVEYSIESDERVKLIKLISDCYSDIPELLSANINILGDNDIKIRNDETCKVINL